MGTDTQDHLGLADRVALVTGGSRGIGKAVVTLLASYGAKVVVNYLRDERAAAETVAEAKEMGGDVVAIQADVSKLDEGDRLVKETVERFGRVDFLICNAGIWQGAAIESMPEELWDRTMDINLKGTWSVCRVGRSGYEKAGIRPHRNRQFHSRAARRRILFKLRGIKGRSDRVYQVAVVGTGAVRGQRQFGRARLGDNRHDVGRLFRRCRGCVNREDDPTW